MVELLAWEHVKCGRLSDKPHIEYFVVSLFFTLFDSSNIERTGPANTFFKSICVSGLG